MLIQFTILKTYLISLSIISGGMYMRILIVLYMKRFAMLLCAQNLNAKLFKVLDNCGTFLETIQLNRFMSAKMIVLSVKVY